MSGELAQPARELEQGLHIDLQLRRGAFALEAAFDCAPGSVTAVLGPNGSGKSTLLSALAGLLRPDAGSIELRADAGSTGPRPDVATDVRSGEPRAYPEAVIWDDARAGRHVAPARRQVGLVLADPLLFGHLSLVENVAFGPRSRGISATAARRRAAAELERVGLSELGARKPAEVSTGQAQRAALARALATDPLVLLLDEPLSALDPQTRSRTRADLHHRLADFAGLTVMVTHDPLDALTLADRLVFLQEGRVVQEGTPTEIIAQPRNSYVAGIVGLNLISGTARTDDRVVVEVGDTEVVTAEDPSLISDGTRVWLTIDPAAVALYETPASGSTRNVWPVVVREVTIAGQRARVALDGPVPLSAEVTTAAVAELGLLVGRSLHAGVKATEIVSYPA